MNTTLKAVLLSLLFIFLGFILYFNFRSPQINSRYIAQLEKTDQQITSELNAINQSRSRDELRTLFAEIIKKNANVVLIAAADLNGNFVAGSADRTINADREAYDQITNDFLEGQFPENAIKSRYYGKTKLHLSVKRSYDMRILTAYNYKLATPLLLRIILELLAIVILCSTASFFYVKRSTASPEPKQGKEKGKQKPAESAPKKSSRESIDKEISSALTSVFTSLPIAKAEVYFYVTSPAHLVKKYEMSNGTFVKISAAQGEIEKRREVLKELRNGSPLIKNRSKSALLPLVEGGELIGALLINASGALKGTDLKKMKGACSALSKAIIKAGI